MENMNLLDLNNDILNIIGGYVKKDNHDKEFQEMLENVYKLLNILNNSRWNNTKPEMRHFIVNFFYVNNIRNIETIDMYLTMMKLNLKRKSYPFSTYCIENLEDSKKTYDEILEKNSLIFYDDTGKLCMHSIGKFLK